MIELISENWQEILPFVAAGFAAQLVDGALGMAFGVIASTIMVSVLGITPARASASVHLVETFTTAASGISHVLHKNVDWKLFAKLVVPGVIGGVLGAFVLINLHADVTRPFVMGYLALIGVYLIIRALRFPPKIAEPKYVAPLGLVGGFLDAAGGGGWGPVVTSNLLIQGASPRKVIGTVNTAEFFLTSVVSATFILALGWEAFTLATVGLLIGGVAAAPLGAFLVKRVSPRPLLGLVGVVLTLTSIYSFSKALSWIS